MCELGEAINRIMIGVKISTVAMCELGEAINRIMIGVKILTVAMCELGEAINRIMIGEQNRRRYVSPVRSDVNDNDRGKNINRSYV